MLTVAPLQFHAQEVTSKPARSAVAEMLEQTRKSRHTGRSHKQRTSLSGGEIERKQIEPLYVNSVICNS